ncbi:MAG: ATP-dependent DNA ligase [Candidatus Odinarchaeota archaeon]
MNHGRDDLEFHRVVHYYDKIEKTSKRLEIIDHLKQLFLEVKSGPEDAGRIALLTSGNVFLPWETTTLGMAEKSVLKTIATLTRSSVPKATKLFHESGDLGLTAEKLFGQPATKGIGDFFAAGPATSAYKVKLNEVFDSLIKIGKSTGPGTINQKLKYFSDVFRHLTPLEARYYTRMAVGQMRLRASVMTILDGLAEAYLPEGRAERKILEEAYNVHPDLGFVARELVSGGAGAVKQITATPGIPIRLMAAQKLNSTEKIYDKLKGNLIVENKYDGARVQVHRSVDGSIKLFSRNLDDMTFQYPDVVAALGSEIKAKEFIIEGEIVGIDPGTGKFRAFQELMQRRRKYGIEEMAAAFPVNVFFFDVLYYDGNVTFLKPLSERRQLLESLITGEGICKLAKAWSVPTWEAIEQAMVESIEEGCEGIIAKSLSEPYQAGIRGWNWIKYKKDYRSGLADSFDLVVVGVYPGRGKRTGTFGTYLMAAYDDVNDTYKTACKLGTGFSDEDLAELQKTIEPHVTTAQPANVESDMKPPIWVNPEIVFEIEAAEITVSPEHTCSRGELADPDAGLSLRFPRFIRLREDKDAEIATLTSEITEAFGKQFVKKAVE